MKELKELIQPYWVEGQQGVYIPLIDTVLLKDNVSAQYQHLLRLCDLMNLQITSKFKKNE